MRAWLLVIASASCTALGCCSAYLSVRLGEVPWTFIILLPTYLYINYTTYRIAMNNEKPKKMTFDELADLYCSRQDRGKESLKDVLMKQKELYSPSGWMLLECQVMDSSSLGKLVIVPYGPSNTVKELLPQGKVVDVDGRASTVSCPIGYIESEDVA